LQEPGGKLGVGGRYARHELEHGKRGIEGVSARWSSGCFAAGFGSADTGSAGKQGCVSSLRLGQRLGFGRFSCRHVVLQHVREGEGPPVIVVTRTWQVRSRAGIFITLRDTGRHPALPARSDHLSWVGHPHHRRTSCTKVPAEGRSGRNVSRMPRAHREVALDLAPTRARGQPMPAAGTRAI
jgi:hypothetical protein